MSGDRTRSRGRTAAAVVVAIVAVPLLVVPMIVWHELGHTVAAWLVGDRSAHFALTDAAYGCLGCNLYDSAALAPLPNAIVNAAGVIATQAIAWVVALVLVRRPFRLLPALLLGDVVLVMALDLVAQCVQSVQFGFYDPIPLGRATTYVDGPAVVGFLAEATGWPEPALSAALVALAATDLVALVAVLVSGVRRRRRTPGPRQISVRRRHPVG